MPLTFEQPHKAKLIDVNPRSEVHGKDLKPALDLRFEMDASHAVLDQLHRNLAGLLFERDETQLPGVDSWALRLPKLKQPLHWDDEAVGNDLSVDMGVNGEERIELHDCRVHKHVIHAKEGGTVTLSWTASCTHDLTRETVGLLGTRVQHDVAVALRATQPVLTSVDI